MQRWTYQGSYVLQDQGLYGMGSSSLDLERPGFSFMALVSQ
jgi:hypothetical protein